MIHSKFFLSLSPIFASSSNSQFLDWPSFTDNSCCYLFRRRLHLLLHESPPSSLLTKGFSSSHRWSPEQFQSLHSRTSTCSLPHPNSPISFYLCQRTPELQVIVFFNVVVVGNGGDAGGGDISFSLWSDTRIIHIDVGTMVGMLTMVGRMNWTRWDIGCERF